MEQLLNEYEATLSSKWNPKTGNIDLSQDDKKKLDDIRNTIETLMFAKFIKHQLRPF